MWWMLAAACFLIYALYKTVKAGKIIDRFLAETEAEARQSEDDDIDQKRA